MQNRNVFLLSFAFLTLILSGVSGAYADSRASNSGRYPCIQSALQDPSTPTDVSAIWNQLSNIVDLQWKNPAIDLDGNLIAIDSVAIYVDGTFKITLAGPTQSYVYKTATAGYHSFGVQVFSNGHGSSIAYAAPILIGATKKSYTHNLINKPVNNLIYTIDTIYVPENADIQQLFVTIDTLTHSAAGDLNISLISPQGIEITLLSGTNNGYTYEGCIFSDSAASSISSALTISASPFTGVWKPIAPLAQAATGGTAGYWQIKIYDKTPGSGSLEAWSVSFIEPFSKQNSISWSVNLSLSDASGTGANVTFGQTPTATDGIDSLLGEFELPPLPPAGAFDARFKLPAPQNSFSKIDYRNDTLSSINWTFTFQPGYSGYPMAISWDPLSLPAGKWTMQDLVTGSVINIDMTATKLCTITQTGISGLKIIYDKTGCTDFTVNKGWNLVSVPLKSADMSREILFPVAMSNAFSFDALAKQYSLAPTLAKEAGYWLEFPEQQQVGVCGTATTVDSITVNAGWNLIGVGNYPVSVNAVSTVPQNIIPGSFFGFDNGYVTADALAVGHGYWVKTSSSGTVILSRALGKSLAVKTNKSSSSWGSLTFCNADGNKRILYAARKGDDVSAYELPPLPPSGIFDVRYASGYYADNMSGNGSTVKLQSVRMPLTITAAGMNVTVTGIADNEKFVKQITDGSSLTLTGSAPASLLIMSTEVSKQFALRQNYPNPFNPSTTISYDIPMSGKVSIIVYDVLGREMVKLVDESETAGSHTATFNGSELTSGMYICRLTVGNYHASIKMLLVK